MKPDKEILKEYVKYMKYGESKDFDSIQTYCVLTFINGYEVTGTSVCYDPVGYDPELGKMYALEDAMRSVRIIYGFVEHAKEQYRQWHKEVKSGEEEDTYE